MISELLADFGAVDQQELAGNPAIATLNELRSAIHQNRAFLGRHPTSLFQQLHNTLSWRADDSSAKHFRANVASLKPQAAQLTELQSLLRRWIRERIEVAGPFTIAASLRPPQHPDDVIQSIGNFDSAIRSLYFTESSAVLIGVASRDKGDAVRDRKAVCSAYGLFETESGFELFPPLEVGTTVTASGLFPDGRTMVLGDVKGKIIVAEIINQEILHIFDSGHGSVGHRMPKVIPASESKGFDSSLDWSIPPELSEKYEQSRVRDRALQGLPWSAEYAEDYEREKQQIHHVVWLKGGSQCGTLALDGTIRIWNASTFQLEGQFDISGVPENSGSIGDGVAVTRSDALYCCKGVHLCHFELESLQLVQHVRLDERTGFPSRNGFRVSHDDQHLIIGGGSGVITLWDLPSLELKWKFSDPLLRLLQAAAFSAKDEWLLLGTNTGDVFVFETATGRVVAERNAVVGASITALDISEDGTLAVGAADGQIRLIAIDSLINVVQLKGHRSQINDLAVIPRSGRVITASDDRTAMLWDVANLDNPILLEGHSEGVGCVAATKDQDILATGGNDSQVIVWRTFDGQRICNRRTGMDIGLSDVAFSPNRTWIAACGNRYAWVWFLEGEEVYPFGTFHAEEDGVHQVVFDPSGEFLFALHSGHVIDGWRIRDGVRGHKDRLPWRDVEFRWKQAQRPQYEWKSEYRLRKNHHDVEIWREHGIIGWWPGRGRRIEALTPTRFVIWQGGSALEFVDITNVAME